VELEFAIATLPYLEPDVDQGEGQVHSISDRGLVTDPTRSAVQYVLDHVKEALTDAGIPAMTKLDVHEAVEEMKPRYRGGGYALPGGKHDSITNTIPIGKHDLKTVSWCLKSTDGFLLPKNHADLAESSESLPENYGPYRYARLTLTSPVLLYGGHKGGKDLGLVADVYDLLNKTYRVLDHRDGDYTVDSITPGFRVLVGNKFQSFPTQVMRNLMGILRIFERPLDTLHPMYRKNNHA
jgi:hypothetical protein